VEIKNFEQGIPMISPVEVRLFGDHIDSLQQLAGKVENLLKNTEGTLYVNNPVRNNKTDIRVDVNRQKALAMGVPSVTVDQTVRMALAGVDLATYTDPLKNNSDYLIRLGVPHRNYPDLSVFDNLYINTVQGTAVPLKQIATLELESSPSRINHINKLRTVSVNSFVKEGYQNDRVIGAVIDKMETMVLPSGYHYEMGGEVETREQSFGGFGTIIMIAVF